MGRACIRTVLRFLPYNVFGCLKIDFVENLIEEIRFGKARNWWRCVRVCSKELGSLAKECEA